jgi:hypothetical protein
MANTPKPVRQAMKADDSFTRAQVKTYKALKAEKKDSTPQTQAAAKSAVKKSVTTANRSSVKSAAEGKSYGKAMNKAEKNKDYDKSVKIAKDSAKATKKSVANMRIRRAASNNG